MDSHFALLRATAILKRLYRAGLLAVFAIAVLPPLAAANHNPYFSAQRLNQPGQPLGTSYTVNHTTIGHPAVDDEIPDFCGLDTNGDGTLDDGIYFGADYWYEVHPHRNGLYRVTVAGATSGYRPVVAVHEFILGTSDFFPGACNGSTAPINVATLPASGFLNLAGGKSYKIQVAGENNPNEAEEDGGVPTVGDFQLVFTYDPDSDGDGLYDSADGCDGDRGSGEPIDNGCPDGDDDDIIDSADQCRSVKGEGRYNGCPDGDGDGNPENPLDPKNDACPGESPLALGRADNDDNGCADYRKLNPKFGLTPGSFFRVVGGRNLLLGIKIRRLVVSRVPTGATVSVSCTRRACKARPKRVGKKRKVEFKSLRGKNLRAGVKLTIKVTAPSSVGEARRYKILRNDLRANDYCLRPSGKRGSCSTRR